MELKRGICLLLVIMFICLGMFAGCASSESDGSVDVEQPGQDKPPADEVDEGEEWLEISLAMPDIAENFDTENPDEMLKYAQACSSWKEHIQ
jgi:hypothetical protein